MKVLITGSNGFIGQNLKFNLISEKIEVIEFTRKSNPNILKDLVEKVDIIFHLAGENRSKKKVNFYNNNYILTKKIINCVIKSKMKPPVIFTSSIRVKEKNSYGVTKKKAEDYIYKFLKKNSVNCSILRLPNIFGKWSKPNHNSFITTCCYNLSRNKKIVLNRNEEIKVLYIDDLMKIFFQEVKKCLRNSPYNKIININKFNKIKLFDLVSMIKKFNKNYKSIDNKIFKNIFQKKMFSTFISYLPKKNFKFKIPTNIDRRGSFTEFSKRDNFGQISYFTLKPGVTRGEHYHHTKIEKFLVISGSLNYISESLINNKKNVFLLKSNKPEIVYSIPGHKHYFKNNGLKEAIVLVWANEIFDKRIPDTYKII